MSGSIGDISKFFVMGTLRGGVKQARDRLPFGTFLGIAGLVALFFGEAIIGWSLGLFR